MKLYKYDIYYGSGSIEKGIIKSDSEKSAYKTIWSIDHPAENFEIVWVNGNYSGWPNIVLTEISDSIFDENGMMFISD